MTILSSIRFINHWFLPERITSPDWKESALFEFNNVVFQLFAEQRGSFTLCVFAPSDRVPPQKQESKRFSTGTIRFTFYWEFPDCGKETPTYLFQQGTGSCLYNIRGVLSIECNLKYCFVVCMYTCVLLSALFSHQDQNFLIFEILILYCSKIFCFVLFFTEIQKGENTSETTLIDYQNN